MDNNYQVTVSIWPTVQTVWAFGVIILGVMTSLLSSGVACTTVIKAGLLAIARSIIVRVSKTNMMMAVGEKFDFDTVRIRGGRGGIKKSIKPRSIFFRDE